MTDRSGAAGYLMSMRYYTIQAAHWKKVEPSEPLTVVKDAWNVVDFKPVSATAIKIRVKLNKDFASGVHELVVE